ncbi:MAG: PTS sugar transporter subunit IIA [Deferribacteres bacterium]|nr:PTS sugar transporter subunit IIA [candidate division KSB1 bacterium]MCB9500953.1 PTS sugar transporter subunit IIA [Deferribacteres bacterium]
MNLTRLMSVERINLYLTPPEEPPDNPELNLEKWKQKQKEKYLAEFVALLDKDNIVLHTRKLHTDFVNRERQASTALVNGIAVPHVRSRYIREPVIGFARSVEGIEFDSMDSGLSHLFFIIATPAKAGDLHLKIYKQIASMFHFDGIYDQFMWTENPGEIMRLVRQFD